MASGDRSRLPDDWQAALRSAGFKQGPGTQREERWYYKYDLASVWLQLSRAASTRPPASWNASTVVIAGPSNNYRGGWKKYAGRSLEELQGALQDILNVEREERGASEGSVDRMLRAVAEGADPKQVLTEAGSRFGRGEEGDDINVPPDMDDPEAEFVDDDGPSSDAGRDKADKVRALLWAIATWLEKNQVGLDTTMSTLDKAADSLAEQAGFMNSNEPADMEQAQRLVDGFLKD